MGAGHETLVESSFFAALFPPRPQDILVTDLSLDTLWRAVADHGPACTLGNDLCESAGTAGNGCRAVNVPTDQTARGNIVSHTSHASPHPPLPGPCGLRGCRNRARAGLRTWEGDFNELPAYQGPADVVIFCSPSFGTTGTSRYAARSAVHVPACLTAVHTDHDVHTSLSHRPCHIASHTHPLPLPWPSAASPSVTHLMPPPVARLGAPGRH